MSLATTGLGPALQTYLASHGFREPPVLRKLRQTIASEAHASMQSSPEQMALIGLLLGVIGARQVLEVGCFKGYGTLAMALALPADGKLVTLDVNAEWSEIGRRFWRQAGVEDRIEFRQGMAAETLQSMAASGEARSFDFAYVDADKKQYPDYFEAARRLVRRGGLIALDNMFWGGSVADPDDQRQQARTLRQLAADIMSDESLGACLIPIGDGLMLVHQPTG